MNWFVQIWRYLNSKIKLISWSDMIIDTTCIYAFASNQPALRNMMCVQHLLSWKEYLGSHLILNSRLLQTICCQSIKLWIEITHEYIVVSRETCAYFSFSQHDAKINFAKEMIEQTIDRTLNRSTALFEWIFPTGLKKFGRQLRWDSVSQRISGTPERLLGYNIWQLRA